MATIPIIPGLVRDNSIVVYEQMCGLARYKMSMVSHDWNVYCKSRIHDITDSKTPDIKSKKQLKLIVKNNDILSIIKHINKINMGYALQFSCQYSRLELINILIAKGARDWNSGLHGACNGSNSTIVQLMIAKGANDWDYGLLGACASGNMEIALLMITRGATNWNGGLRIACYKGNNELVQWMIAKGATEWDGGLWGACDGDHMELVHLMIAKGANDWDGGLWGACLLW